MIENHIALVKDQIGYYRQQLERAASNPSRFRPSAAALYEHLLNRHQELLAFLEALEVPEGPILQTSNSNPKGNGLPAAESSSGDSTDDLPPELLKQLSGRMSRGETDPLIQIIVDHGGTANLDQILIGLFRKTGRIEKRNIVGNRLYRLSKQGFIWGLPHRKGVYTTKQPEELGRLL